VAGGTCNKVRAATLASALVAAAQNQGNDALKRGLQVKKTFYLREALGLYTRGLDLKCRNAALVSALFSNRAQAHLLLGNNRSALDDALTALRADAANVKARWLSRLPGGSPVWPNACGACRRCRLSCE
jgi:hypothetical protein